MSELFKLAQIFYKAMQNHICRQLIKMHYIFIIFSVAVLSFDDTIIYCLRGMLYTIIVNVYVNNTTYEAIHEKLVLKMNAL